MVRLRIPRPSRLAVRIFTRDFLVWRKYAKASAVGNFVDPLFYLLILGMGLGGVVDSSRFGGVGYMAFLAPGLITSTTMYAATFECTFGSYTRMDRQNTFLAILATPVEIDDIILGEALFGAFKAMLGGTTVLLVASLFGLVQSPFALLVPVACFVVGFFFASLALVMTAISSSYEFFNYYFTLFLTPMFLLSGVFFPIEELPAEIRAVALALPLTWAVDGMRGLVLGQFQLNPAVGLFYVTLVALLALIPATNLVQRRLIR